MQVAHCEQLARLGQQGFGRFGRQDAGFVDGLGLGNELQHTRDHARDVLVVEREEFLRAAGKARELTGVIRSQDGFCEVAADRQAPCETAFIAFCLNGLGRVTVLNRPADALRYVPAAQE